MGAANAGPGDKRAYGMLRITEFVQPVRVQPGPDTAELFRKKQRREGLSVHPTPFGAALRRGEKRLHRAVFCPTFSVMIS